MWQVHVVAGHMRRRTSCCRACSKPPSSLRRLQAARLQRNPEDSCNTQQRSVSPASPPQKNEPARSLPLREWWSHRNDSACPARPTSDTRGMDIDMSPVCFGHLTARSLSSSPHRTSADKRSAQRHQHQELNLGKYHRSQWLKHSSLVGQIDHISRKTADGAAPIQWPVSRCGYSPNNCPPERTDPTESATAAQRRLTASHPEYCSHGPIMSTTRALPRLRDCCKNARRRDLQSWPRARTSRCSHLSTASRSCGV